MRTTVVRDGEAPVFIPGSQASGPVEPAALEFSRWVRTRYTDGLDGSWMLANGLKRDSGTMSVHSTPIVETQGHISLNRHEGNR